MSRRSGIPSWLGMEALSWVIFGGAAWLILKALGKKVSIEDENPEGLSAPPMTVLEQRGMMQAAQIRSSPAREVSRAVSVAAAAGVTEDQQAQMAMHALRMIEPPLPVQEDPVETAQRIMLTDPSLTIPNVRSARSGQAAMMNALRTGYWPGQDQALVMSAANMAAGWQAQANSAKGGLMRSQIREQLATENDRQGRILQTQRRLRNELKTQKMDPQSYQKIQRTVVAYDREIAEGARRIATLEAQLTHAQ